MPIVVDASIVLGPALEEARAASDEALAALASERWIVPSLWWFEVRNVLVISERRNRITTQETARFLRGTADAATIDRAPDETVVLDLARRHRLTVYDAAYLELAMREGVPLATLDASLAEAARREGVPVLG